MDKPYNKNDDKSIVYVTRDIERALGFDMTDGSFHILTNDTKEAQSLKEKYPDQVHTVPAPKMLDTYALLEHPNAASVVTDKLILVFKNTSRIEKICNEKKLTLLNPPAQLANLIEEKVSQVGWLADMREFLPPHEVTQLKHIKWEDRPFIIQYNHTHSGEGTFLITDATMLEALQAKFPERDVRKTAYITGTVFTSNVVVTKDAIVHGNISQQITGITPFTDLPFATVGVDWKMGHTLLSKEEKEMYRAIEHHVGSKMQQDGWRGLFGLDVVRAPDGTLFLLEVNARQAASASTEALLQKKNTILEAHLNALRNIPVADVLPLTRGGYILQRVTKKNQSHYPTLTHNSVISRIIKEDYIMEDEKTVRPDIYLAQERTTKTLSKEALAVIDSYLSFSIEGICISIPYYNNARQRIRGGLNVFTGKGSPADIKEELKLLAHKGNIPLDSLSEDGLKEFLVANNIGIDCSGLVYFVLDAEMKARNKKSLAAVISHRGVHGRIGALRAKLRPLQNTNVAVFRDEHNSHIVALKDTKPGDCIILTGIEGTHVSDHVLIVHKVVYQGNTPTELHYTHTIAWSSDGKYKHGVRQGVIEITNISGTLSEQKWTENGTTNKNNETRAATMKAKYVAIHRILR